MSEFKRIFSPKLLLLFILLIAVAFGYQLFSFPYVSSFKTEYQKELEYYSEMSAADAIAEISGIEAAVDYESLVASKEFFAAQQARSILLSQLEHITQYPEYLDSVHANVIQMRGLAIFSTGGNSKFNAGNIEKTDIDFPEKSEVRIGLANTLALEGFSNDKISSLCVLLLLTAVITAFISERKNSLAQLVYGTPEGRKALTAKRLGILLFTAVIGIIFIKGASLAANIYLYGLPDFSAPVQSSAMFKEFTYPINTGQYLALAFAVKIAGALAAALLIWAIVCAIYHLQTAIIAAGAFLAIEYAAFSLIPNSYALVLFRFLNVFAFVDTEKILLKYLNVNLFGNAVRGADISLFLMPIVIIACSVFIMLHSEMAKPIQKKNALLTLYGKLLALFSKASAASGLLGVEFKKILWHQKGIIVVIALMVWCFGMMGVPPANSEMYEPSLSVYQTEFQGEVTENTLAAIENKIDEVKAWENSDIKDRQLRGLETVKAEAEKKRGTGLWLVNPVPLAMLNRRHSDKYQITLNAISLLAVVLLSAGIFAFENQSKTNALLNATEKGKHRLIAVKLAGALIFTVFVWLLVSAREMHLICDFTNNTEWLKAPLKSIEFYSGYQWNISVLTYTVFLLLKRLLALLAAAGGSLLISAKCKKTNTAVILSAFLTLSLALTAYILLP